MRAHAERTPRALDGHGTEPAYDVLGIGGVVARRVAHEPPLPVATLHHPVQLLRGREMGGGG